MPAPPEAPTPAGGWGPAAGCVVITLAFATALVLMRQGYNKAVLLNELPAIRAAAAAGEGIIAANMRAQEERLLRELSLSASRLDEANQQLKTSTSLLHEMAERLNESSEREVQLRARLSQLPNEVMERLAEAEASKPALLTYPMSMLGLRKTTKRAKSLSECSSDQLSHLASNSHLGSPAPSPGASIANSVRSFGSLRDAVLPKSAPAPDMNSGSPSDSVQSPQGITEEEALNPWL